MSLADPKPMLEGVRVVDLTSVVFGPYATQVLADLGAEVIKVEPPSGDAFRHSARGARTRGMSPAHMNLNRGKRSAVLDLKSADDLHVLRELLTTADVFIHNVRLNAAARLGLDPQAVRALNPQIVYAHCTGFGSGGPYDGLQAYDDVIQAASGTTTLLARVDGDPRPRFLPSLIADKVAGLHGAYAVLAALVHKLRTGEGQTVEVPMFEAFTAFMMTEHLGGLTFDPPVGPAGYPRQLDPERQPFPTADGHIVIVPYTDEAIVKTFAVLEAAEVLDDPRFADRAGRGKHISALYALIAQHTPGRTTAEWLARFHAASIPAMPVRDLADILHDPHLQATGFFTRRDHPTEGGFHETAAPVRFGARPWRPASPAPTLGEHTAAVRAEVERLTAGDAGGGDSGAPS